MIHKYIKQILRSNDIEKCFHFCSLLFYVTRIYIWVVHKSFPCLFTCFIYCNIKEQNSFTTYCCKTLLILAFGLLSEFPWTYWWQIGRKKYASCRNTIIKHHLRRCWSNRREMSIFTKTIYLLKFPCACSDASTCNTCMHWNKSILPSFNVLCLITTID